MSKKYRAGLMGVTGYTGMELVKILARHPQIELVQATSRTEKKNLGSLYPFLLGHPLADLTLTPPDPDELARQCDIVFLAVPHGTAMDSAASLVEKGLKVVDLSADFRLRDSSVYAHWYGLEHRQPDLLAKAVYGLPELYAGTIQKAQLVANPGCYPVCSILALKPALQAGIIHTDDLIIDAKSGVSGAGRSANVATLFCEVADSFKAYNLGQHRHTPEIEQELSCLVSKPLTLSFNPHLVPMNRGMLCTSYAKLCKAMSLEEVHKIYCTAYSSEPWVRVLPATVLPQTRFVRGTMYCDIGLVTDQRTRRLLIVSAIDNLCRGASGQAVANANLMLGLPLTTGLELPGLF